VTTDLLDDASLPTDIPALKAEIAVLERKMQDCAVRIKDLMGGEDPTAGIFYASAIHEAKQLLMMLRYQKELRVARVNRRNAV
jgi:hypothetical protein